jgi:peroxiredoxin
VKELSGRLAVAPAMRQDGAVAQRPPAYRRAALAAALALLATLPVLASAAAADDIRLPAQLIDVRGEAVDIAALAGDGRLFIVTLKSTSCDVCVDQLDRLRRLLPRLRVCGARFVVVAPGTPAEVAALAAASDFPYPFVADRDLALARATGLVLGPGELVPAVLEVDAERRVIWQQRGRAPGAYSDPALLERLQCANLPTA